MVTYLLDGVIAQGTEVMWAPENYAYKSDFSHV